MNYENRIKEAKRWVTLSEDDLSCAKILSQHKKYAQACFYCLQSAEKSLKAIWNYAGEDPNGHNILKLIEDIKEKQFKSKFAKLRGHAILLNKLSTPIRFPNCLPEITLMEAYEKKDFDSAMGSAIVLFQEVKDLI